jgi:hypothetical protein
MQEKSKYRLRCLLTVCSHPSGNFQPQKVVKGLTQFLSGNSVLNENWKLLLQNCEMRFRVTALAEPFIVRDFGLCQHMMNLWLHATVYSVGWDGYEPQNYSVRVDSLPEI